MTFLTQTNESYCKAPRTVRLGRISLFDLMSVYRQRRKLATMTTEQLNDLGLTREQAVVESRRSLWDIMVNMGQCR